MTVEAYRKISNLIKNNDESIHETTFVNLPKNWENGSLDIKWKSLFNIKQEAHGGAELVREINIDLKPHTDDWNGE